MDHSHFCYAPLKIYPEVNHVEKNFITFGCFNNFNKVTDSILIAWREILNAVPNSKLILKSKIFDTEECRNFISERLKNLGLNLDKIEMRVFSADYLEQYNEIDIALDTFPYNGGLTTCEALYMGVPVISRRGNYHGSKIGASILTAAGLPEFVAQDSDDYIKKAIELANGKFLDYQKNHISFFRNIVTFVDSYMYTLRFPRC